MSKIHDYTSRVDVLNTDPLNATLTFETDYSKSVIRVFYDREIGKYWTQARYKAADTANSIADIDAVAVAKTIYDDTRQKFAEGLGKKGIRVDNSGSRLAVGFENFDATWTEMPDEDLRAFALHVIREFDTRYVPSLEEVEREVVAGLKVIGEAA